MSGKIFVYGSLMKNFFNYDLYLRGHVLDIEPAYVKGTLYDMPYKGYPAILEGDQKVWGEVITVKDIDAIMPAVDRMEGYMGNDDDEYKRVPHIVTCCDGSTITLDVYQYNLSDSDPHFKNEAILIENGDWRQFKMNQ